MSFQALPQKTKASSGYLEGVPYISPSQVRAYKTCSECYRLRYIERVPAPTGEALLVGGAVHEGIETARAYVLEYGADAYREDAQRAQRLAVDSALSNFNHRVHAATDRDGNPVEIRWNKTGGEDKCASRIESCLSTLLPALLEADIALGLSSIENRIYGLGLPLDEAEAQWYAESGCQPIFPDFGVMAFCDVLYEGWLKDTKTRGQGGDKARPSQYDLMQLALYEMPFHRAGDHLEVGVDVLVTSSSPEWKGFHVELSESFRELVVRTVNWTAAHIVAGDFDPSPNPFCDYLHGQVKVNAMVSM